MIDVKYTEGRKFFHEGFGITPQRAEQLLHGMKLVVHEYKKPKAPGEKRNVKADFFLVGYKKLAQTDEELCFLLFQAGMSTKKAIEEVREGGNILEEIFTGRSGENDTDTDECDCENCVARRAAGIKKSEHPLDFLAEMLRRSSR